MLAAGLATPAWGAAGGAGGRLQRPTGGLGRDEQRVEGREGHR